MIDILLERISLVRNQPTLVLIAMYHKVDVTGSLSRFTYVFVIGQEQF